MGGQLPPEWIEERIMQEVDTGLKRKGTVEVMEEQAEAERDRGDSVEEGGRGDRANESGVLLDKMFENAIEIEPNQTYPLSWAVYREGLARRVKQKRPTIRNNIIEKITDAMIDIGMENPEYQILKEGKTQYGKLNTGKVIELAWKRVIADQLNGRQMF